MATIGKKRRGRHTTVIDLAKTVYDIVEKVPSVSGVSPGPIRNGKGLTGGAQKVKIGDMPGAILLTVRQSHSVQELRVYTTNGQEAKLAIARGLRDNGIRISFTRD